MLIEIIYLLLKFEFTCFFIEKATPLWFARSLCSKEDVYKIWWQKFLRTYFLYLKIHLMTIIRDEKLHICMYIWIFAIIQTSTIYLYICNFYMHVHSSIDENMYTSNNAIIIMCVCPIVTQLLWLLNVMPPSVSWAFVWVTLPTDMEYIHFYCDCHFSLLSTVDS